MKSVLISIKPKWCELIASGKKTVEVRKTKPKIDAPFKCYIYQTNGKGQIVPMLGKSNEHWKTLILGKGKVIGEFVCDRIDIVASIRSSCIDYITVNDKWDRQFSKISCLNVDELGKYLGFNKDGYAWHISNLVIYDKPKKLRELKKPCNHENDCCTCDRYDYIGHKCYDKITSPPQSWTYCELGV